ncbi:MAG: acyl carrier protein [[Ruminococcus] torques]
MIEKRVKEILTELSGKEHIETESSLQNDLSLDRQSMVALLIEMEKAFDIQFNETDKNPFGLIAVQDVADLVKKYYGDDDA